MEALSRYAELESGSALPGLRIIPDHHELISFLAFARWRDRIIVMTTGVFDVIHSGHPRYLEAAKELGGARALLVVGVDTDDWVRARKGPGRPHRPLADRLETLAHFRAVDLLTIKNQAELSPVVRPHISVISETSGELDADQRESMEYWSGCVLTLPAQSDLHSTDLLTKMNGPPA